MRNSTTLGICQEATALVIRAESFSVTTGPHLSTPIAHYRQDQTVTVQLLDRRAEFFGTAPGPIEKDVDTNQLFPGTGALGHDGLAGKFFARRFVVLDGLEDLRRLAQTLDHGLSKKEARGGPACGR